MDGQTERRIKDFLKNTVRRKSRGGNKMPLD